jgi:hypothetical protein
VNGHLPARLQDLAPDYVSASVLRDPWGNPYKYLPQPQRYLVIGFTSDNKPDTDLFLSHAIDAGTTSAASKPVTGGIQLVD